MAAGVTVFEALKAYDELQAARIAVRIIDPNSVPQIDRATLLQAAKATNGRFLTAEDHYLHGGIGDSVLSTMAGEEIRLTKMGISQIPHSGKPDQLLDHYGIAARAIVEKVKQLA
ncbi:transketolase C-terminal domain-containing protein [uncultured Nitrospira sp.]|uniref:transketolase C-terminal domain-containing protein n=1 Tax=uncultured Nitrospira sp. TaxID=157176 RepID=UPI00313FEB7E